MVDITKSFLPSDVPFTLPQNTTETEEIKQQKGIESNTPAMGEAWSSAKQLEDSLLAADRIRRETSIPVDADYKPNMEQLKELTDGIDDPNEISDIAGAYSYDHAQFIRNEILVRKANEETVAAYGSVAGPVMRLAAAIADPGAALLGLATTPFVAAAYKANRFKRILAGGTLSAAENMAVEALLQKSQYGLTADDIAYAGLGSLLIGGSLSALTKGENVKFVDAVHDSMDQVDRDVLKQQAGIDIKSKKGSTKRDADDITDWMDSNSVKEDFTAKELDELLDIQSTRKASTDELKTRKAILEEVKDYLERSSEYAKVKVEAKPEVTPEATTGGPKLSPEDGTPDIKLEADELVEPQLGAMSSEGRRIVSKYLQNDGTINPESLKQLSEIIEQADNIAKGLDTELGELDSIINTKTAKAAKDAEDASHKSAGGAATEMDRVAQPFFKTPLAASQWSEISNAPVTSFAKIRFSMAAKLKSDSNPFMRWMGNKTVVDNVGNKDNSVVETTAEELASRMTRTNEVMYRRVANLQFNTWLEKRNATTLDRYNPAVRTEFFEQVSNYILDPRQFASAEAKAVANEQIRQFKDFVLTAKRTGVAGFENVGVRSDYLPRLYQMERMTDLNAKFGTGAMEKYFANAVKSGQPHIDPALAAKIGKGMWKRLLGIGKGIDVRFDGAMRMENRDFLRELMIEGDVDEDVIESVIDAMIKKTDPSGKSGAGSRGKARMVLDESWAESMKALDGTFEEVKFTSLLEMDAEKLFYSYNKQMSGHIALAEKGFKSRAEFDKWIDRARDYGPVDESNVDRLNMSWDMIVGNPVEGDPRAWYVRGSRMVRGYNDTRLMGQVGLAQIPDFGNVIAVGGFRTLLKFIPELHTFWKRAKNGTLSDELLEELEPVLGMGTDWMRHTPMTRVDEPGTFMGKTEEIATIGLNEARRATTVLSLLAPINTLLQRTAVKSLADRWVKAAFKNKDLFTPDRMKGFGLSDQQLRNINEQIKLHTKFDTGFFGKKVRKLDLDTWTNTEARDAFSTAMYRMARRFVQEGDIGSSFMMQNTWWGKTLAQYRTFSLHGWDKSLLYNIKHHDFLTFQMYSYGMMLAGITYIAQTHLKSIGMENREAYLNKQLSLEKIAAASYNRAGFSSLVPGAYDTLSTAVWADKPTFGHTRGSGLESNFITGAPAYDLLVNKLGAAGSLVKTARSDYDLSEGNVKDLLGGAVFGNTLPVIWMTNILMDKADLPKYSQDK